MKKVMGFIDFAMEKASRFSVLDYAIFKTTLLSIGILLGTYLAGFFKKFQAILWIVSLCSYAYLIYRIFLKDSYRIKG